jgi:hypothetical protein
MLFCLTIKTPELRAKRGFQRVENLVVPDRRSRGAGVVVDEHIERLFRTAIEKHYLVNNGKSFAETHNRFKGMYENYNPVFLNLNFRPFGR